MLEKNFASRAGHRQVELPLFPTIDSLVTGENFTWAGRGPGRAPGPADARWCSYGFLMACQWFLNEAGDGTRLDAELFHRTLAQMTNLDEGLPERRYLEALAELHEIKPPKIG
jgi:hypothetical protein